MTKRVILMMKLMKIMFSLMMKTSTMEHWTSWTWPRPFHLLLYQLFQCKNPERDHTKVDLSPSALTVGAIQQADLLVRKIWMPMMMNRILAHFWTMIQSWVDRTRRESTNLWRNTLVHVEGRRKSESRLFLSSFLLTRQLQQHHDCCLFCSYVSCLVNLRESYRSLNQSLKFFDCNFRCEPRADDSELDWGFFTNAAHLIQNIQLSNDVNVKNERRWAAYICFEIGKRFFLCW